jgi:hypothetical protein
MGGEKGRGRWRRGRREGWRSARFLQEAESDTDKSELSMKEKTSLTKLARFDIDDLCRGYFYFFIKLMYFNI